MHKLLILYPEPVDRTAFRAYYESTHLPLVVKLPGLISHNYSLDVHAMEGEDPYFAVFEAYFASAEAMGQALTSPEGAAVAADVPNYASGGVVLLNYPAATGFPSEPERTEAVPHD